MHKTIFILIAEAKMIYDVFRVYKKRPNDAQKESERARHDTRP